MKEASTVNIFCLTVSVCTIHTYCIRVNYNIKSHGVTCFLRFKDKTKLASCNGYFLNINYEERMHLHLHYHMEVKDQVLGKLFIQILKKTQHFCKSLSIVPHLLVILILSIKLLNVWIEQMNGWTDWFMIKRVLLTLL